MIKFIASDLDGTLLTERGMLPENTFETINKLYAKGILFSPASGRQYANLKKTFAPVEDKVVFICENGALVKYKGETVYALPVNNNKLKGALDILRSTDWARPMLCGEDCAYIENDDEPFAAYAFHAYTNCKKVDNLDEVIGKENVCKIAVYDKDERAETRTEFLENNLLDLRTVVSGHCWCDISAPEVNKGVALRIIRQKFGLKKEECMSFGDHMNDYEMLAESGEAFVTENGYPPLKQLIRRTVASNRENGVLNYLNNEILK